MKICFATNNAHKLAEVRMILGDQYVVQSLKEAGFEGDIPETHETLEENSLEKAAYVFQKIGIPVFSDDSGLEIQALSGRPGVHSAHYAGTRDADANMNKVIQELDDKAERGAQFRTVITYYDGEESRQFEGIVSGRIAKSRTGADGFGYDPIFIPDGYDVSFAEMSAELKNSMSHRKRATEKLVDFLDTLA